MPRLLALGLALLVLSTPARADIDYSDIWYEGAAKSGWGVNLAQNANAIFATFFVYDTNKNPTWFGGTLFRVTDGNYTGPLYTTKGPYFGTEPFDPAQVTANVVGTMTFTATEATKGTFSYTNNGVSVLKSIERQSLVALSLAGTYVGAERYTYTGAGCANAGNTYYYLDQYIVTQVPVAGTFDSALTIKIYTSDTGALVCQFSGNATQRGRVFEVGNGTSTCPNGTSIPLRIYDARLASNGGIELQWTAQFNATCTQTGRINALLQ